MNNSIYIYGPQGCGKTRNAEHLCKHYGLTVIIDEYGEWRRTVSVPKQGALVIGQTEKDGPAGITAIPFEQAMQEMTRPVCALKGMIRPGAMCSQIIVGLKYCGYKGECPHKVEP